MEEAKEAKRHMVINTVRCNEKTGSRCKVLLEILIQEAMHCQLADHPNEYKRCYIAPRHKGARPSAHAKLFFLDPASRMRDSGSATPSLGVRLTRLLADPCSHDLLAQGSGEALWLPPPEDVECESKGQAKARPLLRFSSPFMINTII